MDTRITQIKNTNYTDSRNYDERQGGDGAKRAVIKTLLTTNKYYLFTYLLTFEAYISLIVTFNYLRDLYFCFFLVCLNQIERVLLAWKKCALKLDFPSPYVTSMYG